MTLNDLELLPPQKNGFFCNFFYNFWLHRTFWELIAIKSLEIDQDNLRMKFFALNADFSNLSLDPLGS